MTSLAEDSRCFVKMYVQAIPPECKPFKNRGGEEGKRSVKRRKECVAKQTAERMKLSLAVCQKNDGEGEAGSTTHGDEVCEDTKGGAAEDCLTDSAISRLGVFYQQSNFNLLLSALMLAN